MKIEFDTEDYPQMKGCISPEDYIELWRFARLRTGGELFGLLSFGEMMDRTESPLYEFTRACAAWLQVKRNALRDEVEDTTDESPSRCVH